MRKIFKDTEEKVPKGLVVSFVWDDGETTWVVHEPIWDDDVIVEDNLDCSRWIPGPSLGEFETEREAYAFLDTL